MAKYSYGWLSAAKYGHGCLSAAKHAIGYGLLIKARYQTSTPGPLRDGPLREVLH